MMGGFGWLGIAALSGGLVGGCFGAWLAGRSGGRRDEAPASAPQDVRPLAVDTQLLLAAIEASLDARLAAGHAALQASMDRLPQVLQRALQVELDFLGQQQAQRDATQAARDEALYRRIGARQAPAIAAAPVAATPTPRAAPTAPHTPAPTSPAVSARPPELLLTPLPRPAPVYEEAEPVPELSDEELDALPPELPEPDRPRRRILPAPKAPTLRKL